MIGKFHVVIFHFIPSNNPYNNELDDIINSLLVQYLLINKKASKIFVYN